MISICDWIEPGNELRGHATLPVAGCDYKHNGWLTHLYDKVDRCGCHLPSDPVDTVGNIPASRTQTHARRTIDYRRQTDCHDEAVGISMT